MPKKVAKKSKSAKKVSPVVQSAPKRVSKHSLSDTTLMFLALFFVLAALFIVLMYKRQSQAFQQYLNSEVYHPNTFIPPTGKKPSMSPEVKLRAK